MSAADEYKAMREAQKRQAELAELAARDPEVAKRAALLDKQTEAFKELANRELAKRHLLPFTVRLIPGYTPGWVHEDICRRLEKFARDVIDKKSPRLMLLVPPRHGKSQLASICFPVWFMSQYPDAEMISCSYNQDLAEKFSRQAKWILDDPEYQVLYPEVKLDPANNSISQWGMQGYRGAYVAAGVGGGLTGRGCWILTIDDPIKDAEQADSETVKENIWDWYGSTAYTRLAPGGGVLIIQTQWADDDLAGRVMQAMSENSEADQFEIVRYPALATDYEYQDTETHEVIVTPEELPAGELLSRPSLILRRAPGDALHPERYSAKQLNQIKRTLQPRHWSALYQQNPVPDDGAYFRKDTFYFAYPPDKKDCHVYIAWDFAITEKNHSDFTVGTVTLQDSDDVLHAADMVRFRSGDSKQIIDAMIAMLKRWYNEGKVTRMGVEDGQIWRAMQTLFFKTLREQKLYHLAACVEPMRPLTDKMARARPLQGRMQQHMFVWPDSKPPWFETAQHELLRFPAGAHDDCHTYATPVECPDGARPIGELRDGDEVLTYTGAGLAVATVRNHHVTGTKRVIALHTSRGDRIELTPTHPVLTRRGYVYAGALRQDDEIAWRGVCRFRRMGSSGRGSAAGTTSRQSASAAHGAGCTGTRTSRCAGSCRPAPSSTTATETRMTIGRRIWSALRRWATPASTRTRCAHARAPLSSSPTSSGSAASQSQPSAASTPAGKPRAQPCACGTASAAAHSSSCPSAPATACGSAPSAASRRRVTGTRRPSGPRHVRAFIAALRTCLGRRAWGTSSIAPSSVVTGLSTRRRARSAAARTAAPSCCCARGTLLDAASHAELQRRAVPVEQVLDHRDAAVTNRATRDADLEWVTVSHVSSVGERPTYNFDVEHTRNYLVHGGYVVHNCVDSWAWNAQLAVGKAPPTKPQEKPQKSWRDKLKIGKRATGFLSA